MFENFELIQKRYRDFWNFENSTPILMLSGIEGEVNAPKAPEKFKDRWCDIGYLIENHRAYFDKTFYVADAYPLYNPNLGPDIFGATLGADLIFEETTSYSVPFVHDWLENISFKESNIWWQKIKEITQAFVDDSRGDYIVGITDLHPGADGLVSIRSPQELCYDVIDQPEVFKKSDEILLPAFKKQFETLYNITQKYQKGTSNWMGIYSEDPWYVTSSDFICMISNEYFRELVLPEIIEEVDYLKGNTIFHLDGPDALKHLDSLLEIPNLKGVQWVYGAGQPSARHWMNELKKIQAAGKNVVVSLDKEDIVPVFNELSAEGLCCSFNFTYTKQEAIDIEKTVRSIYNSKG